MYQLEDMCCIVYYMTTAQGPETRGLREGTLSMSASEYEIPDNVPADLAHPYQYQTAGVMSIDPFGAVAKLHEGTPIFWNPENSWHDCRGTFDLIEAAI